MTLQTASLVKSVVCVLDQGCGSLFEATLLVPVNENWCLCPNRQWNSTVPAALMLCL